MCNILCKILIKFESTWKCKKNKKKNKKKNSQPSWLYCTVVGLSEHQAMEVFLKKAAVKNFTISTEITWVWPSFLKSTMSEGNFIKKTPQHMCFLVNIVKFLRLLILKNICEWLLFDCFNGSMLHGLKIVYRLVN